MFRPIHCIAITVSFWVISKVNWTSVTFALGKVGLAISTAVSETFEGNGGNGYGGTIKLAIRTIATTKEEVVALLFSSRLRDLWSLCFISKRMRFPYPLF